MSGLPKLRLALLVAAMGSAAWSGPGLTQDTARAPSSDLTALHEGFEQPPQAARLRAYWWWLNGNTDQPTITNDLEQMKRMGFGGALLIDANGSDQLGNRNVPAGPTFGSPAFVKLYLHALKEAQRLGLEISLNITSGWNTGGPDVTPEEASKLLTYSRTVVEGGTPQTTTLAMPPIKNGFYRQIAVLAYPLHHGVAMRAAPPYPTESNSLETRIAGAETGFSMPDSAPMLQPGSAPTDTSLSQVRDVGAQVKDGVLTWTPPPGQWEVLRIGYTDSDARVSTSSGDWQGLSTDYLSPTAFDQYWNRTVVPLLDDARPYLGNTLRYLVSDSWELGGTNWTDGFRETFIKRRGYDPVPYLPAIAGRTVESPEVTARFLADLRRTVADLVTEHYDEFAARARQYGLGIHPESGGPHGAPIDALETFRSSAFPQTEFWAPNPHRPTDPQRFFTKEAASAANIYGKPFVAQEGMTTIGPEWSERIADEIKPAFDQALTEGMTRLVWHQFTSSPRDTGLPGQEYFAGTHFNPKVTWWNDARAVTRYLNRGQFMMQQGLPVNDLLYYYGAHVPNFVRNKADDPANVLPGYDYDVTNQDALTRTITMKNGVLSGPDGRRWRALALPRTRRISLPILRRIAEYVDAGGTVVGLAPTGPVGIEPPETQQAIDALVSRMWQGCTDGETRKYGAGTIYCTTDSHKALTAMGIVPDFQAPDGSGLDYAHRRTASADIYFVRNGKETPVSATVRFRVSGRTPQLWDAVTGRTGLQPGYRTNNDGTISVDLNLPGGGSVFVVFTDDGAPATHADPVVQEKTLATLGDWTLRFPPNWGAPTDPIRLTSLESWTDMPQAGIRYFSGTATYATSVDLPRKPSGEVLLDFDKVYQIARVTVNGHDAGTIWARPYQLDIGPWLQAGKNSITVETTNLWPNRIIGDLQPGAKKYTQTNITVYKADSPLLPSGLIGPARLIERE